MKRAHTRRTPIFRAVAASPPSYTMMRWRPTMQRAVPEVEQPYAVSESLAHGLVSRLAAESAEADRLRIDAAGVIPPSIERADAYHRACAWLAQSIPHHLLIHSAALGAPTHHRSGKDDRFVALHWAPDPGEKCLVARLHVIHARNLEQRQNVLLMVTVPALMRAFYRLKTMDSRAVLRELEYAAMAALAWHKALCRLPHDQDILLPTPNGALAVARDAAGCADFGGLRARTWLSDRRMADNIVRLAAVRRARLGKGVVINCEPFPLLQADPSQPSDAPAGADGAVHS